MLNYLRENNINLAQAVQLEIGKFGPFERKGERL
jgi:hypothetical protein